MRLLCLLIFSTLACLAQAEQITLQPGATDWSRFAVPGAPAKIWTLDYQIIGGAALVAIEVDDQPVTGGSALLAGAGTLRVLGGGNLSIRWLRAPGQAPRPGQPPVYVGDVQVIWSLH